MKNGCKDKNRAESGQPSAARSVNKNGMQRTANSVRTVYGAQRTAYVRLSHRPGKESQRVPVEGAIRPPHLPLWRARRLSEAVTQLTERFASSTRHVALNERPTSH